MCGARKKLRRVKVDTNMNRHVLFLTMLAGSAVALAQEPPHTPFPPLSPLHPRALRDDMDEVRAQAEVIRSQIDVEGIRESVRAQVAAMAPRIAAQAGAFAVERAFALAPQKMLRGRHDSDDRAYERGQRALDRRNWDEALESFTQVAGSGGSRARRARCSRADTPTHTE